MNRLVSRYFIGTPGMLLILSVLLVSCGRDVSPPDAMEPSARDPVAQAIFDLSGRRTRITWVQDVGDATDYLARGNRIRLMAFDTEDGRGERVLLPAGRNMAKPMFSADGTHVIFSDRDEGAMYVVGWEENEPTPLGKGFALHTWRDPATGVEWLYYAVNPVDDDSVLTRHEAIYRKPLFFPARGVRALLNRWRGRDREELVWNRTLVSEDSYQLSADGYFASAPFPWPNVGVHIVASDQWNRHGRGCWVAMSPDNEYLFWIMDGAHRNLVMERVGGTEPDRWTVNINNLPDTDRYEVYHPRWSNHSRIMAVTGPYTHGEGGYRLCGGGRNVEIWLGRFAADHRSIEHWARATYNNLADFYPDVWIDVDPVFTRKKPAKEPPVDRPLIVHWPSDTGALVYLWEHGTAQNEILMPDTEERTIFSPALRKFARYNHRHAMWLDRGYSVDEDAPGLKGNAFALECRIESRDQPEHDALILGYGPDAGLFDSRGEWLLKWDGQSIPVGPAIYDREIHLVVSVSPGYVETFINGEHATRTELAAPLADRPAAPLYFGGYPGSPGFWGGTLSHVAVYQRTMNEQEAMRNHRLVQSRLELEQLPETEIIRARVIEAGSIPRPEDIAPYRRALAASVYEIIEGDRAGEHLQVARWVILDGEVLKTAPRPEGSVHMLNIQPYDKRPELEGERLTMDNERFELELYYDLNL